MKSRKLDTNHKNLIVSLILYTLIAAFGAWRGFVILSYLMPALSVMLYSAGYLLLCTALPLGFFLPHSKLSKALDIFGNYWLCFQLTFFFGSLMEWTVKLITVNLLHVLTKTQYAKVSMILFVVTVIATVYGIIHARVIRITRYDCPVRKPGIQGKTLTIAHLSDLHLGSINDYKAIKKVVERVNSISPDLICITGDTFTENIKDIFERKEMEELFRSLKSRYGTYACLGNHDSGSDFSEMLQFFKNAGIRLLCEEGVDLDGILLYGRTDMTPGGDLTHRRKAI
ncbi:MAG TPA: metallophosphoesterase, partial [Candidatus Pelethocola excrementipullorum]|nr:metallophosphoesterase [Candidatus Pelethocola excrementipullorum]